MPPYSTSMPIMREDRARVLLATVAGDPRVIFVTGKGGVGKTAVSKLITQLGIEAGLRCARVNLGEFTSIEVANDDDGDLEPEISAPESSTNNDREKVAGPPNTDLPESEIKIEPADALLEYLEDHGFGKLASRLLASGVIGVVSTAIPGIKDLLLLGKIKQLEKEGRYDLLVIDSPSTGHALSFLTSPEGLRDIARVGPLRIQAEEVIEMIGDPQRTGCVVVTIAEETPVAEAVEAVSMLSSKTGVAVASVVVNQTLPLIENMTLNPLEIPPAVIDSYSFRKDRELLQEESIIVLENAWHGPVVRLPQIFDSPTPETLVTRLIASLFPTLEGHSTPTDPGHTNEID